MKRAASIVVICEGTLADGSRCSASITRGKYHADHDTPDALGGQPTFENARLLCIPCHREKTKADQERIFRAKRVNGKFEAPSRRVEPDLYDARPMPTKPMPQSREAAEKKAKRQSKPSQPAYIPPGFEPASKWSR